VKLAVVCGSTLVGATSTYWLKQGEESADEDEFWCGEANRRAQPVVPW
jgi:hypothetical protein